ncbi:IS1380 family transposase [Prosthecodimorpha staleyi]|uniref:IS1380 family transposase n=1 Tax=Prosthecodimorpha staleyi TaxID=2840188 RepID=A0A947D1D5_9HYPH|nr:IS1380 family transposase [Prosthecodimorpha staleyi]MBT9288549.1 IS1380 family transposase [Prosthecodimorpha staleyi]
MSTQCSSDEMDFGRASGRAVVAAFDGGLVTSDAGALLLGATDRAIRLVESFAASFRDSRDPNLVEHSLTSIVGQRVFGPALGYEDLIDHDDLRRDPVLGAVLGKPIGGASGVTGSGPKPLAGKSTPNRLEHAPAGGLDTRYHKIRHDGAAIEALLVDLFLDAFGNQPPRRIVLYLDATDGPLHGHQEGRFFHGHYDGYCYLPLYVFCGRHLLAAKLRRSNINASAGAETEIARIVAGIRARWPRVSILLRADSGFARETLMLWCEQNRVDYVFGLARNARLEARIAGALDEARRLSQTRGGAPAHVFRDFLWTTKDSWSRQRRVIAKAEWTRGEANPRFLVTSLADDDAMARPLYEDIYCARGEMENRIKECQANLFADRRSTATMRANQLRLWFASMAYVLVATLRRIGLAHTELATATCGTIRLRLLKIGALVRISARRIKIARASTAPAANAWRLAATRIHAAARASPA